MYELALPENWGIHPVFNIDRLKLYKSGDGKFQDRELVPVPPELIEDEFEYEVADIIGHRWSGKRPHRKLEYLVLWAGYDLRDSTYQTEEDLKNSPEILLSYRTRKNLV